MKKLKKTFLFEWIMVIGASWPISAIIAIILSYTVLNLFYPKETNLIVGLCMGGLTGFAQWFLLKEYQKISKWWIFLTAIGFGIPYAAMILLFENGIALPFPLNNENIAYVIFSCVGGFFTGLLQIPILKSFLKKTWWWLAVNTFAWGISMSTRLIFEGIDIIFGGFLLGILTGYPLIWLINYRNEKQQHYLTPV